MIQAIETMLPAEKPDWVLFYGDTHLALNCLPTRGRARLNDFRGDPHLASIDWMMWN